MHPAQVLFIIMSLIFIFMAIKAHSNTVAQKAKAKKVQQRRQRAPLYYRTASV